MRSGKVKPIFRGLTIAAAGDFGGGQWIDTNIARWVGLRQGKFVRAMDEGVTHLVCLAEEFRRRGSMVKAALKRQNTCEIVTLDWLEDCMHKGKRLDEEPYSHLRALRRERERERKRLLVLKGLEKAEKEVNTNLYHIYRDHTFFQYEVVISRDDDEAGIPGERYVLTFHESNAIPRLYWFVAKFYKKKGDPQPKIYRPSYAPATFAREFAKFQDFFEKKTGISWPQRLVKAGTTGKNFFQYQPPTGGKPVGWVPRDFVPTELPDAVERGDAGSAACPGLCPRTEAAITTVAAGEAVNTARMPVVTGFSETAASPPVPQTQQRPGFITPGPSPAIHQTTVAESRWQEREETALLRRAGGWFQLPNCQSPAPVIDLTGAD